MITCCIQLKAVNMKVLSRNLLSCCKYRLIVIEESVGEIQNGMTFGKVTKSESCVQ